MSSKIPKYLAALSVLLGIQFGLAQAGVTLNAAMQTNPPTLDPHMTTTTATQQIAIHVFEPLLAYCADYSAVEPVLAESWEMSEDALTYTFTIRSGVQFHNGKAFSAEDAVASLRRLAQYSPISGFYEGVDEFEVVDDTTFRVHLSEPIDLIASMAVPVTWQAIMPAEQAAAAGEEELRIGELIGTGPFKIVEWRPDVHVLLEAFEGYAPVATEPSGFCGRKEALVDQIRFIPVKEPGSRIAGLETGEYDFAESLPITSFDRLEGSSEMEPRLVTPQWAVAWELNKQEPPMNNPTFRQAVLAALNMEQIMRTVAMNDSNFFRVRPGRFFEEQAALYTEVGGEFYNQADPARAQELLAEAGYEGEEIVILSNRDYDWMYRATLAAAPMLEQAGIKVRLEFSDWPSQIGKALTLEDWHINQTGWSLSFNPVQLKGGLQTGAPYAYGYENPQMDELLAKANMQMSEAERKAVVDEIQDIIYSDVPYVRFGDLLGLEGVRSNIAGYESWYVVPRFWNVEKQ